jgi:hypothetical protein
MSSTRKTLEHIIPAYSLLPEGADTAAAEAAQPAQAAEAAQPTQAAEAAQRTEAAAAAQSAVAEAVEEDAEAAAVSGVDCRGCGTMVMQTVLGPFYSDKTPAGSTTAPGTPGPRWPHRVENSILPEM